MGHFLPPHCESTPESVQFTSSAVTQQGCTAYKESIFKKCVRVSAQMGRREKSRTFNFIKLSIRSFFPTLVNEFFRIIGIFERKIQRF